MKRENVMADWDQIVPLVTTTFTLSRIHSFFIPIFLRKKHAYCMYTHIYT